MSKIYIICFSVIISYLLGSINIAIIISWLFHFDDPRSIGSGNPGTTNIFRIYGKKYAALVLVFDILKGYIPILIANILHMNIEIVSLILLFSIIGHMYPIFFSFRGGKGIATIIGCFGAINIIAFIIIILLWIIVFYYTKYSSLSSIISVFISSIYIMYIDKNIFSILLILFINLLIMYKHRENIIKLINNNERKFYFIHKK